MKVDAWEKDRWDALVRSFEDYDVFYLNAYARAFCRNSHDSPALFYYEDEHNRIMNVVLIRDIADDGRFCGQIERNRFFDLSTPYGYGGPWGRVGNAGTVREAFGRYCREQGYVSEFVRFELFGRGKEVFPGEVQAATHNVVRSLDLPLEELWMDFEHKVRKNLKRAAANHLEILIDEDGRELKEFQRIYSSVMDRRGAKENFYFEDGFYETLHEMKGHFCYFHAVCKGRIVSTELVLCGSENCYSFLGGTRSEYFETRPNEFLKYEIIKWAKARGYRNFVLGGGYGQDDGIFRYKKSLAPNGVTDFCIGKHVIDEKAYRELIELRRQKDGTWEAEGFFPQYRG